MKYEKDCKHCGSKSHKTSEHSAKHKALKSRKEYLGNQKKEEEGKIKE